MLMMVTSGTKTGVLPFQELLDDIREGKVATVITKDRSDLDATTSKPERIWKSPFLNTVSAILQSMMVMIPTSNPQWILPRSSKHHQ